MLNNARKYISRTTPRGVQYYFCSDCGGIFPRVNSVMKFSFADTVEERIRFDQYCQDCIYRIKEADERCKMIRASHTGGCVTCQL